MFSNEEHLMVTVSVLGTASLEIQSFSWTQTSLFDTVHQAIFSYLRSLRTIEVDVRSNCRQSIEEKDQWVCE